jgi:rSAM/selenodomain-associated transferase 2
MLSIVIPTLNAAAKLPAAFSALVPGVVTGLVKEVIVVDGGSSDATIAIADAAGATMVAVPVACRGAQLMQGASVARQPWLLFLHADTVLDPGWVEEVQEFIDRVRLDGANVTAAAFRFALDDGDVRARMLERAVGFRSRVLGLPYGDQGLLIRRDMYEAIGGYRALRLMEDVDIVRRLPRGGLTILRTAAVTSSVRYRRDGYLLRPVRNVACLTLYFLGAPIETVARVYEGRRR